MNKTPSKCSFDIVPDELVIRILHFGTCADILSLAATCKRYSSLVAGSVSLQLHIELEVHGLHITQKSSNTKGDYSLLLRQLQRYRDAWLDLDLGPAVHAAGGTMSLWELRDGFFVNAFQRSQSGTPDSDGPNSLRIFSLDTHDAANVHFGTGFLEFTLDMNQELVVLVSADPRTPRHAQAHMCSSTTGQVHPLAKHPGTLSAELGFDLPIYVAFSLSLEIMGEVVAVKFASPHDRLYEILIWNWKTGALLNRISCENGICDFVFLDIDRLVLWSACTADGGGGEVFASLLIYEKIRTARAAHILTGGGVFDIPTFPKLSPTTAFEFPKLSRSSVVSPSGFFLNSDPSPGRNYTASNPFSNSRAITLGLTMAVINPDGVNQLRIIVDVNQLFDHLRKSNKQSVSTLSWDTWGENATRWFHAPGRNFLIRRTFGSRFIAALNSDDHELGACISVVEFHSPTIRRHSNRASQAYIALESSLEDIIKREKRILDGQWPHCFDRGELNPSSGWLVHHSPSENAVIVDIVGHETPTVITLFEQLVISRLPYRIVTRVRPVEDHRGWLIDGNHVIGIDYTMTIYTLGSSSGTTGSS